MKLHNLPYHKVQKRKKSQVLRTCRTRSLTKDHPVSNLYQSLHAKILPHNKNGGDIIS